MINHFKNAWKSNFSFFEIFVLFLAAEITYILTLSKVAEIVWPFLLFIATPFAVLALFVFYERRLPKAKKNSFGILFAIDFSDESQYELINRKFVQPFLIEIEKNSDKEYQVILLNDYLSGKWKVSRIHNNRDQWYKLLIKTRCKLVIMGSCVHGGNEERHRCTLNLKAGICHKSIDANVSKMLGLDMSTAFSPLSNIKITKSDETDNFEINAYQLSYAVNYMLASTALICGDYEEADSRFLRISEDLKYEKRNIPVVNNIRNVIKDRLTISKFNLAKNEYELFVSNHDDQRLIKMKKILDSSKEYLNDLYEAKTLLSIYCFWINRDIKSALKNYEGVENSRNLELKQIVKFNIVFLRLYENDNLSNFLKAYKQYKKADQIEPKILIDIEKFVFDIYEKEPNKHQLAFLLFMIYDFLNNKPLAEKYLEIFIDNYFTLTNNESFSRAISEYKEGYPQLASTNMT